MSLASKLLSQLRNPTGWLGRWNLRGMNRRHSNLTDWGLRACFDRQRRRDSRYRLRRRQDHSQTGCHCHEGQGLRCGFLGNKCCCIPQDERGVHQVATSRNSPRFGFASAVPRPDVCSRHRCRNSLLLARLAGGYVRSLTRPKTRRSAGHRRGILQGCEIRPACSKICRHDAKNGFSIREPECR